MVTGCRFDPWEIKIPHATWHSKRLKHTHTHTHNNLVFSLLGAIGGGGILNPLTKSQSIEKTNQSLDMGDAPRA